jgi:uncharacterized protein (TIGR02118 family)
VIKVIYFIRKRSDISGEQFRAHYEAVHVPLSRRLFPLMRRHARNYVLRNNGDPDGACDCITECWFDDWEALKATNAAMTDEIRAIVTEDEARFMDRGYRRSMVVEETVTDFRSA